MVSTNMVITGIVVCFLLFIFFTANSGAKPPLRFDSSSDAANTKNGGGGGGGDSDTASIRAELMALRAELRAGRAPGAGGGLPAAAPPAAPSAPASRTCPPCPQCLTTKCPISDAPAIDSGAAGKTAAPSSNMAERCAKFPINFPPSIKRITVQVGAHMGPLRSNGDDHAIISFEPQVQYVNRINTELNLPNVYMIPAAVSLFDGVAFFDMAGDHTQSASLNKFNDKIKSWSGKQGSDLDIMKSGGSELRRFNRIEMEVQVGKFNYYQSDNSKTSAVEFMQKMGFRLESATCNGVDPAQLARDPSICEEENAVFVPTN